MAAVAVESSLQLKARLRAVPREPAAWAGARPVDEPEPAANGDVKPWELHSELALVCPEVRECARELLPERDPDAFLARVRAPVLRPAGTVDEAQDATSLPVAVAGYALWRLAETVRSGLVAVAAVVALAVLAQVLH
ncbi:MAG: hypothetical protein E6G19_08965 [Actinobacteria bacterium]|nr:MAG: hypothetical protein E6G19_08965 [Actinomycetota bacterium]